MFIRAKRSAQIVRHLGPGWAVYRAGYALQQKSGWLARQLPATSWSAQPIDSFLGVPELANADRYLAYRRTAAPPFFFDPTSRPAYASILTRWDGVGDSPHHVADNVSQGIFRYFDHLDLDVGCPPDWHCNALTGEHAPVDLHWSRQPDFGYGDIKAIWEPSRFGFTFALVRSYWRTGEDHYAELFWQLLEDWRQNNPPYQGVNWKCGQETSLRVMAWCFGLYGFLEAPATTPERVAGLAQMIAVSGRRIAANLRYALSQRNNHGISEGMGLWTIGLLFPELQDAAQWRIRGRQVLEQLGRDLIYDDGSFVQHSVNYHRLMLHDYLWALRLGEINGMPFSDGLRDRVQSAGEWLYQIQDQESGQVPWYGQTDGANILPLTNCDYLDMRPVVQATQHFGNRTRCFEPGPWDEALFWLFGEEALDAPLFSQKRTDLYAENGGYYTLRSEGGFAFVRCASYRDRPGQADMLHVDLWWRGQSIARDAGTYSYNAPEPWNNPLAATSYHNTVIVDGLDQMDRVGRFLWLPWLNSQTRTHTRSSKGGLAYWEGEHDGYTRLPVPVSHRRSIISIGADNWLVLDRLQSSSHHRYRLHWLLHHSVQEVKPTDRWLSLQPNDERLCVQILDPQKSGEWSLVCGDEDTPRGWRAPYYHARDVAPSLTYEVTGDSILLGTWFGPQAVQVSYSSNQWQIAASNFNLTLEMSNDTDLSLVSRVSQTGVVNDRLDL